MLITMAYDILDFQLLGGPSWMASEHYDIAAKAEQPEGATLDPASMTDEQIQSQSFERLRLLLADRFHKLPVQSLALRVRNRTSPPDTKPSRR